MFGQKRGSCPQKPGISTGVPGGPYGRQDSGSDRLQPESPAKSFLVDLAKLCGTQRWRGCGRGSTSGEGADGPDKGVTLCSPRNFSGMHGHQCEESHKLETQGYREGVRLRTEDKDWLLGGWGQ